jgi:hypothetical protein
MKGSVGRGGANRKADVLDVQRLLNFHVDALGLAPLAEDGAPGDNTIKAIRAFQARMLDMAAPDGLVAPSGRTWKALTADNPALSGAKWWHANQAKYPNSAALSDLKPPFRDRAKKFLASLETAGARIAISSTLRHPIRAHLMHYCWTVAKGLTHPADVPPKPGCAIVWDHGALSRSRAAAAEMVALFGMAHIAALQGLHIDGHAIDVNIGWSGTLSIKVASGHVRDIGSPRNGVENAALHAVGATYGVHKLRSDPPHWSINGH